MCKFAEKCWGLVRGWGLIAQSVLAQGSKPPTARIEVAAWISLQSHRPNLIVPKPMPA